MKASIDFTKATGRVKPMHAVNNGPVYKFAADQRITNMDAWKEAGIPYARTHDASFNATYGGEHTVDVNFIFPNFDADPYDEASYDFAITDEYLRVIDFSGTKTFYRLGSKIEHACKKYNTLPPRDFNKWAVICEHIIRHYTEGWANGFKYDIEYWEIWNEPDLDADDSPNKRTWGGTRAEYFDLYEIASKHLKSCFPHLKIGGPALAGWMEWADDFLGEMRKRQAPIDFFSWHSYAKEPSDIGERCRNVRAMLDKHGFTETESINNEWNYVRGWTGEDWLYSLKSEKGLKGSSFIAGVMCECQYAPIDMMMYYDARPCGMNGMFNTDFVCECLKGYYPFRMFNELYKLDSAAEAKGEGDILAVVARSEERAAVMLTHYNDDDSTEAKEVTVDLKGFGPAKAQFYLLDENNDMKLVKTETFSSDNYSAVINMTLFSTYLIILNK